MSWRIRRICSLLAAVGATAALSVAAAPASALVYQRTLSNWVVSGSLTPKKLNEPIALPPGSTFNGSTTLNFEGLFENISGSIGGTVSVPPFNADLKLLGLVPTTVGVTFEQAGAAEGSVVSIPNGDCPNFTSFDSCVNVNVPTKVNIGLTMVGTLGLNVPTHCVTSEPIDFQLNSNQTLLELIVYGPRFSGTATIPPMSCEGPEALTLAPALTLLMSGPDNPYSIAIAPPPTT